MKSSFAADAPPNPLARFAAKMEVSTPEQAMSISCGRLRREIAPLGPPPLPRLLERLGARREDIPLPTAGRLRIDEQGYLICVRAGTHWRRARFTVAHEIGHILLCEGLRDEPPALRALRAGAHWVAVERLCNQAAAELLMPADDFRQQVEGRGLNLHTLSCLGDHYGVSWDPLAIRFDEVLGLAISRWREHQRHPDERVTFRVERSWGSGAGWLPTGLTARHLEPDVVSRAAHDGEAAESGALTFGGKSRRVFATAVSLGQNAATSFDTIEAIAPDSADARVLLFLNTPKAADAGTEGNGQSPALQQLALLA